VHQSRISQQEAERVAVANERAINEKLVAKFQTMEKAAEMVREAAQENGVSVKEFQDMARTRPLLVERLLGLTGNHHQATQPAPVRGSTNKSVERQQADNSPGTPDYWTNMKATDPLKYYSAAMSRQRIADRTRWKSSQ